MTREGRANEAGKQGSKEFALKRLFRAFLLPCPPTSLRGPFRRCLWRACLLLIFCAGFAQAQGTRKDDLVINARGLPVGGASVAICAQPASTSTTPCSPLALIYSNAALTQALVNPVTTDGLGNYSFYAAPGKYTIQIYGPTITTKVIPDVTLPNDPSAPSFTSISTTSGITAFSLTLSGNLTVSGSASVTLGVSAATLTLANQASPPGAPSTGNVIVYTKTADKNLYSKDETGAEVPVGNVAFFNVKKYGAKGDSTTDDTTAAQSWLTACVNAGPETLFAPAGGYKITSALILAPASGQIHCNLLGNSNLGTVLRWAGPLAGTALTIKNNSRYRFDHMELLNTNAAGNGTGVLFTSLAAGSSHGPASVRNLTVANFNTCVQVGESGGQAADSFSWLNLEVTGCTTGVSLVGSNTLAHGFHNLLLSSNTTGLANSTSGFPDTTWVYGGSSSLNNTDFFFPSSGPLGIYGYRSEALTGPFLLAANTSVPAFVTVNSARINTTSAADGKLFKVNGGALFLSIRDSAIYGKIDMGGGGASLGSIHLENVGICDTVPFSSPGATNIRYRVFGAYQTTSCTNGVPLARFNDQIGQVADSTYIFDIGNGATTQQETAIRFLGLGSQRLYFYAAANADLGLRDSTGNDRYHFFNGSSNVYFSGGAAAGHFFKDSAGALDLVNAKRYKASGTAVVAGDFALSSGWGTSPSVSSVAATDQAGRVTITSGTGTPTANPTVTLTFHDGTWTNAPGCGYGRGDINSPNTAQWAMTTISATAATWTFVGTPATSTVYVLDFTCMGR